MYAILFYDIADRSKKEKDNSRHIRKTVEKYLPRVQYSVYEGEIRPSDFKRLSAELKEVVHDELDSIVMYRFESMSYSERLVLGQDKNESLFS